MSPPNGVPPGNDGMYLSVPTDDSPSEETSKDCVPDKDVKDKNVETEKSEDACVDEAEVIVPPDGGWGWVVVFGSFMCNLVVDGIIFSFGMFLKDIETTFEVSSAQVSLAGSLLSGFYLMAGPFASALANRYGFRLVAVAGSLMAAAGFSLSYFATDMNYLYMTYGVIGGIGFGLIYVPSVITVGFYFERWRALATGIGVCGSGIGAFLFAPLSAKLVENFGWRPSLLIQSLIIVCCVFFGLLFRPLKPTKIKEQEMKEMKCLTEDKTRLSVVSSSKVQHSLQNVKSNSVESVEENEAANGQATTSDILKSSKRLSVPIIAYEERSKNANGTTPLLNVTGSNPVITPSRRKSSVTEKRQRTESESNKPRSRKSTLTGSDINRPMYRDDIFFGASLHRLPQYTSQSSIGYNLSVTKVPTATDIEEEASKECKCCPEAVQRTLSTMLDFSLFKSPSFLLLAISGGFTMMGFYVPFMFLADRAKDSGMGAEEAVWLVSIIGIANTVGRVLCGVLGSFPKADGLFITNAALTMGGIATLFSGFSITEGYQFTYSVLFGLAISCFASLRSIIVVELLGLENLTNAFGLLCLFQGIAATIGSPLAGIFKDVTGNYDASFYLSGSLILASAIMCYPLKAINRWEKNKMKKNTKSIPV